MEDTKDIRRKAEEGRCLYRKGMITRTEAENDIRPYIELCNTRAKEIALKYKQKPRYVSIHGFLR